MLSKIFKTESGRYSKTMWINTLITVLLAILAKFTGEITVFIQSHPEWGVWGAMVISIMNMVLRHRTSERMGGSSK